MCLAGKAEMGNLSKGNKWSAFVETLNFVKERDCV